jgi:hypothetical protein
MRVRTVAYAVAVLLAAALIAPWPGLAHVPVLEPNVSSDVTGTVADAYPAAARIGGPDVSRALYGYLSPDERFDAFAFTVSEPVTTTVGVLVPDGGGLEGFRPEVSVVTTGGTLARFGSPPGERPQIFEPFSLETFLRSGEQTIGFEPGRRYVIRVDGGSGVVRAGRYVLTFSGAERFTGRDIAGTLVYLPRIWLGLYGEAPPRLEPLLLLAAIVVGIAWIVRARRARRSRAPGVSRDG